MMKTIKYIWHTTCLLSLLLLGLSATVVAQPSSIKKQVLDQVNADKGLKVIFTISMDGKPFKGEYMAYGNRFVLDSSLLKAWYDGANLWVYVDRSDEVNLSQPDPKALWEINPLMNLNSLNDKEFVIQSSMSPDGTYKLIAKPTPHYSGSIELITVYADKQYKPTKITIEERDIEHPTEVQILSIRQGAFAGMEKDDFFRFVPNKLPGKKVIDLR